ncbi:heterodisulfide reductase-related iron-sulfur binding cluster [Bacillus sp. FJAT-44742]|uniref:heterodisulfide reductase-related iron-sulfur binding cluster n=1 Tax=Bacillus sp. FJAT-44742 TaxID=2014005 RepID=UPI000C23A0FD|nr:heterodisulfide reductase-related iron-sulfur binding cluster [Bacillus sp. FJAT-44742]
METFLIVNWIAFLLVVGYGLYLFARLVLTRYEYIKMGKKAEFEHTAKERWNAIIENVFGQKKLLKDKKSGIIHVMFFYGFLLVQFSAIDVIWKGLNPGSHLPLGPVYPVFTLFQEAVVVMILVAVVWAFHRRYIEKLVRLKRNWKAGLVLIFIGGLMVSKLVAKGAEMVWLGKSLTGFEPIASVIGAALSPLSATAAGAIFYVAWWVHLLILLTFLVYVPQSKHAHLLAGPANVWFGRTNKVGQLSKIDFEDESQEEFGVGRIENFNQKQLLDLYACVECGRCTNMCPATGTGKILSPMDLLLKMRDHLTEKGAAVTSKSPWLPAYAFSNTKGNQLASQGAEEAAASFEQVNLIGDVITEEELWACTTCRNCEDQCPVMNEHVDKIIDMRRYLVLTEGKMDSEAQRAMTNIERQGNPWGINRKERENWRESRDDVDAPTIKEMKKRGEEFEYLFFVGSMGSYDKRSQKIAQSFAKLMNEAGVKFAILGNKEKNSGDTPRRIGNEFLFQELATANIDTFQKNDVKKIVTIDPHAYNTFKNEYPEFGLEEDVQVYHHTELLAELVREGKLKPTHDIKETITYHDSCYLGRYNDVYDPPREILKAIPGLTVVEMERNREDGMCCGAGGGMMWMEEEAGQRVNVARTEQAMEVSPSMIGSGCPYCLTMLSDGTKAKEVEDDISTLDIAEILEQSVVGPTKPTGNKEEEPQPAAER